MNQNSNLRRRVLQTVRNDVTSDFSAQEQEVSTSAYSSTSAVETPETRSMLVLAETIVMMSEMKDLALISSCHGIQMLKTHQ
jgi:hypothetical protein